MFDWFWDLNATERFTALLLLANVVLVAVTGDHAVQNRKIAIEMKLARSTSVLPLLALGLRGLGGQWANISGSTRLSGEFRVCGCGVGMVVGARRPGSRPRGTLGDRAWAWCILPAAPHGTTDEMSPNRAAVQVEALGRAVAGAGVVAGEDLRAPRCEGVAERADLLDVVGEAAGDGLVDQQLGLGTVRGQVDVAQSP